MAASSNATRLPAERFSGSCCLRQSIRAKEAEVPAGLILICDDDSAIRTVLNQALGRAGYDVRTTGTAAGLWRWVSSGDGNLVITDVVLPDENGFDLIPRIKKIRPELPIVVMSAQNTILTAITAAERGAFDYLPKPFDLKDLTSVVQRALASPTARRDVSAEPRGEDRLPLIGRSPAMQEIYRVIARLTQTDLTVMIMGESGTGKELVARALHDYGKRRHGAFIAVNMAAIPKELVESELFGHERGAFTGATNRGVGRFEQAEGGTLFLDEIGDMPLEAQTRLLRVLQQGEYTTVGGRTPIKTDVRIIAATNRDLRQLIQQGLFREDLYYRLNVVPMRLPPLRERAEDVPDLVRHFLHKAEDEGLPAKHLDNEALDLLKHYRWPGNVRELENLIRRLAVLHSGETILAGAISSELKEPSRISDLDPGEEPATLSAAVERHLTKYFMAQGDKLPPPGLYDRILQEIERPLLSICLAATRGNQIRAAHLLGLNRNTLRKKIRDLGLEVIRGLRSE
ncbi:MAG TPA: nitrogen regulation protein NR(I) [Rhizomicrobium sp.]|nr:nitrogen regulation protein NR(I) [Rhizomicrobium sp.]